MPALPLPNGRFTPTVRTSNLLFLAGLEPADAEGNPTTGRVDRDFTAEKVQDFARLFGLNLRAAMSAGSFLNGIPVEIDTTVEINDEWL